ncbi:1-deoxy-D-xylulose-5-phosphate synthase [Clostridium tetani]|uniref:1-deoxy-D-xylulose-5-phosphate synthase n=1 Tax=Clostridium tetani (strain Massachusetts / E88) TaxID=212717 RepID=DXS_CLOTE|nr:1-deoxy-D-xylulose-5-phosphate synthase [Clostridium tetani]Q894H0.2 RecName: Full=1-deoxy-D-xylulose-5-phosphate synthase; AltName: Full=1-deoxyxylulose-5-phosphate synthase; Short=DXP synthase; Short=DXPS [Clostridium tetani E88]KGI37922.1 1-deoxy-D-xylulose-5-phosphate synthase [Clostridium tetani]KGI39849.1 1-deoxy-D-xylulose-5-phosphate synthase [Clostridium tetani ATCC 9441]KGI45355.1 1-deoxy-D-xylulose-5-phosphate synthase [Clostridium tetani]KHO31662.1 1-deoxy-D-xylulose-5-phosphate
MINTLDRYKDVYDIKNMSLDELNLLSRELRNFIIESVSQNGGHLASNLGVVELTLSLYNVFDFSYDKLIWDVGHQCYVHKILTGRRSGFQNLRKINGLSGFPKRCESKFDHFETGHSSTSISSALGMARARDLKGENYNVVAVIGDGALTGGMALEALNDVGDNKTKLTIILNDNQMSIGKNVGGLSTYLSSLRIDPNYNKFKRDVEGIIKKIPNIGKGVAKNLERVKDGVKQVLVPGMLFENMGIKYFGPIDGHNIKQLSKVMDKAKNMKEPVIIHVVTTKGKGYKFAEQNPDKFHGIGSFDYMTGCSKKSKGVTYSKAFGKAMVSIASKDKRVVAITAAMKDGTGLNEFSNKFKNRIFDVGIAEQHAVTMAAGMATAGLRPVFSVYSTFLQRAYDQVLHDVCIQNLPVVFAIDRAGLVGEDGETHQGVFDMSYLSHMPNMTIMAPKCVEELEFMLNWALSQESPIAIRYPKGESRLNLKPIKNFQKGKWEVLEDKGKISIIATGRMVEKAFNVKETLKERNIDIGLINATFVKPIDKEMLNKIIDEEKTIITLEDNVILGGFGNSVLNYVRDTNSNIKVVNLGFKDEFIPHGKVDDLFKMYGLDEEAILKEVMKLM